MGIVRVTAMGPGSVEYLLHGCDAKPEQEPDQGLEGPDHDRHGAVAYLEAGTERGEPQGVWLGRGMAGLDLSARAGDLADAGDVRAIFGQLRYPEREVEGSTDKTPVYLGSAPRKYRTAAQIVADALKKEPDAPAERRVEIERSAQKNTRTTHAWYDVTFSPVKSVSVYYTALLAGGDEAGAAAVRQAHFDAIRIAIESVENDLAYVRTGRHEGKGPGGRSVGEYEQGTGLSVALFEHHTNRDGEPQLHAHAAVLARAAAANGAIYAIDGYGFKTITDRITAAYTRAYQQLLTERMAVVWTLREDGKAREITGIDPLLLDEASTRSIEHVKPRVAELVEAYVDRHGREPSGRARRALVDQAVKDTRSPKTGLAGPAAVKAWAASSGGAAAGRARRLEAALDAVDAAVLAAATSGTHPSQSNPTAGHGHQPGQQVAIDGRQAALGVLAEIAAGQAVADVETSGHEQLSGHDGDRGQGAENGSGQGAVSGHGDPSTLAGRVAAAITAGVGDVQAKYATWTAANLGRAIDDQLGDAAGSLGVAPDQRPVFLQTLTEAVLAQPGLSGIVQVSAGDPVPVPDELRRLGPGGDGRSRYRPHSDERYATTAHISGERRVLATTQTPGAPRLDDTALNAVRARLTERGLSADQAAVVAGVLGSGRAADVLVGPAGTGKSHTVGALAREWDAGIGGRVLGVATAEIAARNLSGLGLEAYNTARFTRRFEPDPRTGQVADRLGPRDLVVLDEAGMSTNAEMLAVAALAEQAGAKVLFTGDHHQLQGVGAGGMFAYLADQPGALELDTVHRFEHDWEAAASLQLRGGDTAAATAYVDHGRVRTGTLEEMKEHAVRGHLAHLLEGTDALLIVDSNQLATDLSKDVHEQLVAFGRVDPQVLATLPDRSEIGVGDRILATHNDGRIRVDPGPDGVWWPVTNKEVYEVIGRDRDGQLLARDQHGAVAHLPKEYLDEHVRLAYAVTGHAAQGVTVQAGGHLAGRDASRESVYTAMTRGRESNVLYLVTENEPDPHDPQRIEDTPAQRLADIISRSAVDQAAIAALEAAAAEEASMGLLGALINQVSSEYAHERNAAILDELVVARLGEDEAAAVRDERAYGRLLATVYGAELDGHDPRALLTEAVQMRELDTARAVSEVMHWRVGARVSHRTPEHHQPEGATLSVEWTAMAENMPAGPVRELLEGLTERAVERQTELGQQTAADPPAWARERLPETPDAGLDPVGRARWEQRAGVVAAYREYRGIPDEQTSLGEAPPEAQQFARAFWMAAVEQLDDDPSMVAWRHRSDAELYQAREAWALALYHADEHGPRSVAEDLAATHRLAAEIRTDAMFAQAEADTLPDGSTERIERAEAAARHHAMAEQYEADARDLETAHTERTQWWEQTAPLREADRAAATELARRGQPPARDTGRTPTVPDQLELLPDAPTVPEPGTTPAPNTEQPATEVPEAAVLSDIDALLAEPEPDSGLTTDDPEAAVEAATETDPAAAAVNDDPDAAYARARSAAADLRATARRDQLDRARRAPAREQAQHEAEAEAAYVDRAEADDVAAETGRPEPGTEYRGPEHTGPDHEQEIDGPGAEYGADYDDEYGY